MVMSPVPPVYVNRSVTGVSLKVKVKVIALASLEAPLDMLTPS